MRAAIIQGEPEAYCTTWLCVEKCRVLMGHHLTTDSGILRMSLHRSAYLENYHALQYHWMLESKLSKHFN
jgi:hypothetical protein